MTAADHLDRLDRTLVGPRRSKRGLVREAGDHLEDATGAYLAAGYDRAEAERLAVRDFGTVAEIAPAFQATLAVAAARRTALLLLAVLSIQPFLWDSGLARLLQVDAGTTPSGAAFGLLDAVIEYGGGLVLLLAVLLVVATGIGHRWWSAGPSIARFTGWFGLAAAAFLPVTGVAMNLLAGAGASAWLVLGTLLLAPLSVTAVSARRTLAAA